MQPLSLQVCSIVKPPQYCTPGSGPASNVTANTAVSGGSGSKGDQVDFVSIHHFPEEIQTDLIQIAEWLNLNDHDEFMNIYAKVITVTSSIVN